MSEATLERRCRLAARAYPEGPRAAEVVATLMDSNEGRRGPRPGDVLDVLWHGFATRLRATAPGTRLGAFGDALSVMVVTLAVMQAATAVSVTTRVMERLRPSTVRPGSLLYRRPFFSTDAEAAAAVVAALLAVAAVSAICLGRVRLARLLTALTAAAGLGAILLTRALGEPWSFSSPQGKGSIVAGLVVLVPVLFTTAVARAARVVPAWWWGMAALVCFAVAAGGMAVGAPSFSWRMGAVAMGYAVQPGVLLVLSLPLLRSYPFVVAGAALAGVLVLPFAPYLESRFVEMGTVIGFTAASWAVTGVLTFLALRQARAGP